MPNAALTGLLIAGLASLAPPAEAQVPGQDDRPAKGSMSGLIQCSASWVRTDRGERIESANPLTLALDWAAPGAVIELLPGDYPPLQLGLGNQDPSNVRGVRGLPGLPITVRGRGKVRILNQGRSDTIGINQQFPTGHIWFENIVIEAGYRSAVMLYDLPDGQKHSGFRFYDCTIDGGWNHAAGTGNSSKWGVLGHDLDDFVFAGREGRAAVRDIRLEHAFYLQNPRGNITLENIDATRLGRTFVQITARARSGPVGRGLIRIRGNAVSDAGLSQWDNYKGGSAFTFAGGLRHCTILVEENTYEAGFDPRLRHLTGPNTPYGTGALVAWDGGEQEPNGTLVLRKNSFRFADGCGDRAVVSISACEKVAVEADNVIHAGAFGVALDIQPEYQGERTGVTLNGRVLVENGVELRGDFLIASAPSTEAQRTRLAVPFGERSSSSEE